jgi:hypothetical protein
VRVATLVDGAMLTSFFVFQFQPVDSERGSSFARNNPEIQRHRASCATVPMIRKATDHSRTSSGSAWTFESLGCGGEFDRNGPERRGSEPPLFTSAHLLENAQIVQVRPSLSNVQTRFSANGCVPHVFLE